jgi:pyridoxal/pyridoxine/pyridoxamine kinase
VLTGVYFDGSVLGAAFYDAASDKTDCALAERVEGYYHGTGDIFASALTAGLSVEWKRQGPSARRSILQLEPSEGHGRPVRTCALA